MDILTLLRDPLWQAVGAGLTGIGIAVSLLLSARFRKWVMKSARQMGKMVLLLLAAYITGILLYATAFIVPILWGREILSSIAFTLLVVSLFLESRRLKISLYLSTKILLPTVTLVYVLPKVLVFWENLRPKIPSLFFSLEVHLLIMITLFAIMQDLRASVKIEQHRQAWSGPLWDHQKQTTEQLSKIRSSLDEVTSSVKQLSVTVSQHQVAQTPGDKPPPQWWQVIEALKAKGLSFTGEERSYPYQRATLRYYDIIIACSYQIDRGLRTLTIVFPKDFIYPCKTDKGYERTIASDIVVEAGHIFEGYAVTWVVGK